MGCWNGTCQASGLSISYGDRIVLIPMVNISSGWLSCWYPIRGTYNDYGGIENVDENFITELITTRFIEESNKENGSVKFGGRFSERIDSPPKNINDIFQIIERETCIGNIVSVKDYSGKFNSLGFCMVLESVYDWMVNNYNKTVESWCRKFDTETIRNFKKSVRSFVQPDDIKNKTKSQTIKYFSNQFKLSDSFNIISRSEMYYKHAGKICLSFGEVKSENAEEYIKLMLDFMKFNRVFQKLRLNYSTPAMAGSQDDNHNFRIKFNNATNKISRTLKKKYEEE